MSEPSKWAKEEAGRICRFNPCNTEHAIAEALDAARTEERARIVAWLRNAAAEGDAAVHMAETRAEYERAVEFAAGFRIAADHIERNEHAAPGGEKGK